MEVTRRDLLALLGVAAGAGLTPRQVAAAATAPERLVEFPALGNVTLLHVTDTHATLRPVLCREPDTAPGVGAERGKASRSRRISGGVAKLPTLTTMAFPLLMGRDVIGAVTVGQSGGKTKMRNLIDS